MNPFEYAKTQIDGLQSLFDEQPDSNSLLEAQTRFLFIDALLFDCLGWDKSDCKVEDRIDGKISDYSLSAPNRILIVEAKRTGISFALPTAKTPQRMWEIQTFATQHPVVYEAIEQAVSYTTQRGTPFGAVTNGHQVIAFLGSRTDGVEPLHGKAVVFDSIADMRKHFKDLWDLLSKPGIEQRRLQVLLQGDSRPIPPSKMSSTLDQYPGLKRRNKLQVQLSTVADYLLEDLLIRHGQIEFLKTCYCKTGALAEYATISKNILRARYSTVFEKATGGPQLEPAVTKSGTTPELMSVPPGRPLLLLGDVGVGKSLFLTAC